MRAHQPDDSAAILPATPRALDEFAAEDLNGDVAAKAGRVDGVFCFECEAQPEPELSVGEPFFEIAPAEVSSGGVPKPLSRVEAVEVRRRARRDPDRRFASRAIAARHSMTRAGTAFKHGAQRTSTAAARRVTGVKRRAIDAAALVSRQTSGALSGGKQAARRLALRMQSPRAWTSGSRAFARPSTETALEHQEFSGFVVSVVLAVVVIGYGGFLAAVWRTPTDARVTRVATPLAQHPGNTQAITALAMPVAGDRSLVRASDVIRPPVVRTTATTVERRAAFVPSARTLTTLWQRRDTRSLDRALATLRRETLAFRSCGMRVTDVDRAVARCEGQVATLAADGGPSSRPAIWTLDFQRTNGRWQIARVTTR